MIPKVFSRKEVAKLTGLSVRTIDRALKCGDLPAKVYGDRKLIFESGVQQFLDNMKDCAAHPHPSRRCK